LWLHDLKAIPGEIVAEGRAFSVDPRWRRVSGGAALAE
jgi:hypothetical protein